MLITHVFNVNEKIRNVYRAVIVKNQKKTHKNILMISRVIFDDKN